MTLENIIQEQALGLGTIADAEIEALFAECEVYTALMNSYEKQLMIYEYADIDILGDLVQEAVAEDGSDKPSKADKIKAIGAKAVETAKKAFVRLRELLAKLIENFLRLVTNKSYNQLLKKFEKLPVDNQKIKVSATFTRMGKFFKIFDNNEYIEALTNPSEDMFETYKTINEQLDEIFDSESSPKEVSKPEILDMLKSLNKDILGNLKDMLKNLKDKRVEDGDITNERISNNGSIAESSKVLTKMCSIFKMLDRDFRYIMNKTLNQAAKDTAVKESFDLSIEDDEIVQEMNMAGNVVLGIFNALFGAIAGVVKISKADSDLYNQINKLASDVKNGDKSQNNIKKQIKKIYDTAAHYAKFNKNVKANGITLVIDIADTAKTAINNFTEDNLKAFLDAAEKWVKAISKK